MKCQSFRIDVLALIWDYKVENDDDSADDIDDDDSSEGTNEDKNDSDEESKSNIKDADDACSPATKKRKYSPAMVSPATENKSHGNNVKVSLDELYQNLSRALKADKGLIRPTHQFESRCVVY
jgi:hypothetical protein